jgi:outer membrane protein OmpA-like peptidoglycan-associated protein
MITKLSRASGVNIIAGALLLATSLLPTLFIDVTSAADSPGGVKEEAKIDRSAVKADIRTLVSNIENLSATVQDLQVTETDFEVRIQLAADVLFDFDKSDIKPQAAAVLKQAASFVRDKAKGTVQIDGHTDGKGSDAYNQKLSERRAASVKNWFVNKEGLSNVKFSTQGFGAKKPVAPNTKPDGSDDPDGRQKNRRVEIVVKK